jgi:hypothetical protein
MKTFVGVFTQKTIFWGAFATLEEANTAIAAWIYKNPAWMQNDFEARILPFGELL